MVKLIGSLIVATLATSSVVAFSDLYERELELKSRELGQDEELVVRDAPNSFAGLRFPFRSGLALGLPRHTRGPEGSNKLLNRDTLDDLEAREPHRHKHAKEAIKLAGHFGKGANVALELGNVFNSRDLADDGEFFERELTDEELLERELGDEELVVRDLSYVNGLRHFRNGLASPYPLAHYVNGASAADVLANAINGRDLEDDGQFFERELSDEELVVRDLSYVNGLRHFRNPYLAHYVNGDSPADIMANAINRRDLEVDGQFFERELTDEELLEREYDLLDERDIFDDLD